MFIIERENFQKGQVGVKVSYTPPAPPQIIIIKKNPMFSGK